MNVMLRIFWFFYSMVMYPFVDNIMEISNSTPDCCGKPCEFAGSHLSLIQETFLFQCSTCGSVRAIPNQHNGLKLRGMFSMSKDLMTQYNKTCAEYEEARNKKEG